MRMGVWRVRSGGLTHGDEIPKDRMPWRFGLEDVSLFVDRGRDKWYQLAHALAVEVQSHKELDS